MSRTRRNLITLGLGALAALLLCGELWADDPHAKPGEVSTLPLWCHNYGSTLAAAQPVRDPMVKAQVATYLRSGCSGIHHYCWALVWSNRAFFGDVPETTKKHYFSVAISDYEYVQSQSRPSCVMVPDLRTKIGELYGLMGKSKEAEDSYMQAIRAKKTHSAAYIGLSDLYELRGDTQKSVAILEKGLEANPRSSALKKKLSRVQERMAGGPPGE